MRKSVAVLSVVAAVVLAVSVTSAWALPLKTGDKATGTISVMRMGQVAEVSFDAREVVGVAGKPGYRPEKGQITIKGDPWIPDGSYAVFNILVIGNRADFDLRTADARVWTVKVADGGSPGLGHDIMNDSPVTAGNLTVFSY